MCAKSPTGKYLTELESGTLVNHNQDKSYTSNCIMATNTTKAMTYKSINPDLSVYPIYLEKIKPVREQNRIAMTRLRLSSRYLKIDIHKLDEFCSKVLQRYK